MGESIVKIWKSTGFAALTLAMLILCGCDKEDIPEPGDTMTAEPSPTQSEPAALPTQQASMEASPEISDEKQEDDSWEWITYTSQEHQFTLQYPSNWYDVGPGGAYGAVLRPYDGTQSTFYVEVYHSMFEDYSMQDYVEDMMETVMRIRSDYSFEEPYPVEIGGYPFTALSYQSDYEEETYYYMDYFTANGYGYIVRYVVTGSEYEQVQPIMEQMAQSFTFTK